jgi:hypothetical protein
MIRAPKSVIENNRVMSDELKDESRSIARMVYDKSISDEVVAEKVADFNGRWIAAGGIVASTLVGRTL